MSKATDVSLGLLVSLLRSLVRDCGIQRPTPRVTGYCRILELGVARNGSYGRESESGRDVNLCDQNQCCVIYQSIFRNPKNPWMGISVI